MSNLLTGAGLHFDEVNNIKVVEPEVATASLALQQDAKEFSDDVASFQNIADGFISIVQMLAEEVEKEKIKAIGARNLIQSMEKQREAQRHQLQALLIEKTTELERLRLQHQSLQKIESEQEDILDRLSFSH